MEGLGRGVGGGALFGLIVLCWGDTFLGGSSPGEGGVYVAAPGDGAAVICFGVAGGITWA